MAKLFDVAVIGAGPGGYVAAIRCAQLGLNTVCIDEWKNNEGMPSLGGTCLNVGCIPSKALLESSENYERADKKFREHGIKLENLSIDVSAMIARKNKIVKAFTSGITMLFKKNKVTSMQGRGTLLDRQSENQLWNVQVSNGDQSEIIQAEFVILATGSIPRPLPLIAIDNDRVLDNVGALALSEVPKRLGVIGAGVIGLEMGSVWRRLGSEVTILEAQPGFLLSADESVAKEAQKVFTRELGLVIQTGVDIQSVKQNKQQISITYTDSNKESQKLDVDKLVIAIGRVPNSKGLASSQNGLTVNTQGFVEVDDYCRTNLPNVFAVGDVVRGPMLAHKASEEGVAVAELIATIKKQMGSSKSLPKLDLNVIPWVIYTSPEIAWVGKTEQALKSEKIPYKVGQFPFMANGRARALGETHGFIKILAHTETDRILGVHMLGPFVSELIAEAVVAMEFKASSEDLARIIHAHPSLSEVLHEAALGVDKRALHI